MYSTCTVQCTRNSQQPQIKFSEGKILHRKMHRSHLFWWFLCVCVFFLLKQLIAFWNNTLFTFHFSKELHVTIVTSKIYNFCLWVDSRGNFFIWRSCCEHPYDNEIDIDLCFPVTRKAAKHSTLLMKYLQILRGKGPRFVHAILKHLNSLPI